MLDYETTTGCRMEFLQRTLDDDTAAPCGRCDNCAGVLVPDRRRASARRRRPTRRSRASGVPIEPRAQWPTGADRLGIPFKGNIPLGERADEGRALARLTDLGWGGVLRTLFDGAAADAPVTDALRDAAIRVLADWPWAQRPASVVALPSRRRPQLVDSFARSIAEAGRLPFLGSLPIRNGGPSGEPGGNSVFRLAGLWDRFDASGLEHPRRARAAHRRPGRQPVDAHRRVARASSRRGDGGAALHAGASRRRRPQHLRDRRGVDHEAVAHIAAHDAVVRGGHVVGADRLDHRRDAVLGAEIEHLLRLADAADVRSGERAACAGEGEHPELLAGSRAVRRRRARRRGAGSTGSGRRRCRPRPC